MKEKKKINVKKRILHVGENHALNFFFFFLKKHFSVQRRKICSSRQEWSMCTNLAHEMQRR